jgi:hypothetical protein|uniref:Transposase n=1 Tax=Rhizobium rhizogenes TaxID=359 RepID=A0A7S4ZSA7_RHIRH|nr:hypothetical protein pC5.8a_84 [Rhizobium rhizogenes]
MTDHDRRHRFPAEIIAHVVWRYFRFSLSLRVVEDMLPARGLIVFHQTIRLWAEKFGRHFASNIIRCSCVQLCISGTSMRPSLRFEARRALAAARRGSAQPVFRSHIVFASLVCDRLSLDKQREFLHGDYVGGSHNQEVWT